jgi:integrase/recombinase XerD
VAAAKKSPPKVTGCYVENGVYYFDIKISKQRHRGSLFTSDPAVAKRERKKKKDDLIQQVRFGDGKPVLFEEIMKKWHADLIRTGSTNTHRRYLCSMNTMKEWLAGKTLLQITKRLLNDMVEERQNEVTNATIRRDLSALSDLFEFAIAKDYCEVNPAIIVWRSLDERRNPINLPHDDDIALVMSRASRPYAALMRAALLTGCRIDELVKLHRRAFDPVAKTLTILGKGNKKRIIDLSWNGGAEFFASLTPFAGKPWMFWRDTDKQSRADSKRELTYVGDQLEDASANFRRITEATEAWCEETGRQFVRFVFHDLRHRHAVDYLASGESIYDLNARMGHSTLKQTEEYLKHITPAQARIAKYGKAAAA